jgi:hypothetical protein
MHPPSLNSASDRGQEFADAHRAQIRGRLDELPGSGNDHGRKLMTSPIPRHGALAASYRDGLAATRAVRHQSLGQEPCIEGSQLIRAGGRKTCWTPRRRAKNALRCAQRSWIRVCCLSPMPALLLSEGAQTLEDICSGRRRAFSAARRGAIRQRARRRLP